MTEALEDVVIEVRATFEPVAKRIGMRGPSLRKHNTYFRLIYFGAPVGLEILVECDHFFVFALPFRSNGEEQLPSDHLGSGGQRVQMHLQEALGLLRIPFDREAKALRSLGGNHGHCRAGQFTHCGALRRNAARCDCYSRRNPS